MAQVELIMPKMGESIMEATILKWLKKEGDSVELDETILEIATDKVDSEIPSPVAGVLSKIMFAENETVEVGKVIALIATEGEEPVASPSPAVKETTAEVSQNGNPNGAQTVQETPVPEPASVAPPTTPVTTTDVPRSGSGGRFYSPLVRNIAAQEGISVTELD
ncbi:MAG: biotin/lipoyl-containing protein, partial [Saprospiraceae bacterium]|nr:biotin/lipoyl-containing protein [Saprospiraceae bacterium]